MSKNVINPKLTPDLENTLDCLDFLPLFVIKREFIQTGVALKVDDQIQGLGSYR